jgi:hypothetical protein
MNTQPNIAAHTPGPWQIMPCPVNHGKHPFHDNRWITTAGTVAEFGHDPRSWDIHGGSLICEMRDGPAANARLIAAAPDLLAALEEIAGLYEDSDKQSRIPQMMNEIARAAIARATGTESPAPSPVPTAGELLNMLERLVGHVMHYATMQHAASSAHKDAADARALIARAYNRKGEQVQTTDCPAL